MVEEGKHSVHTIRSDKVLLLENCTRSHWNCHDRNHHIVFGLCVRSPQPRLQHRMTAGCSCRSLPVSSLGPNQALQMCTTQGNRGNIRCGTVVAGINWSRIRGHTHSFRGEGCGNTQWWKQKGSMCVWSHPSWGMFEGCLRGGDV